MNASYSFAQAKSLVVDDLARQKTQDSKQASEPKRQKFRPSRLMIGVIGIRIEEGGAGERQPDSPGRGHFRWEGVGWCYRLVSGEKIFESLRLGITKPPWDSRPHGKLLRSSGARFRAVYFEARRHITEDRYQHAGHQRWESCSETWFDAL